MRAQVKKKQVWGQFENKNFYGVYLLFLKLNLGVRFGFQEIGGKFWNFIKPFKLPRQVATKWPPTPHPLSLPRWLLAAFFPAKLFALLSPPFLSSSPSLSLSSFLSLSRIRPTAPPLSGFSASRVHARVSWTASGDAKMVGHGFPSAQSPPLEAVGRAWEGRDSTALLRRLRPLPPPDYWVWSCS